MNCVIGIDCDLVTGFELEPPPLPGPAAGVSAAADGLGRLRGPGPRRRGAPAKVADGAGAERGSRPATAGPSARVPRRRRGQGGEKGRTPAEGSRSMSSLLVRDVMSTGVVTAAPDL